LWLEISCALYGDGALSPYLHRQDFVDGRFTIDHDDNNADENNYSIKGTVSLFIVIFCVVRQIALIIVTSQWIAA
jgi:hypothetical protein